MDNYNKDLVLVDDSDNIVGTMKALTAHHKDSLRLHRAFSLFLVDEDNKLLMQQRSSSKLVFPNKWANTVCSHPFLNPLSFSDPVEDCRLHLIKRMEYELGITNCKVDYVTRLYYKATDKESFGHVLEGHPLSQSFVNYEILDNIPLIRKSEYFFEWEVDYIFVCKANVQVRMNKEEVQDVKKVNREEFNEMVKDDVVSQWTVLIVEKSNIFDLLEKL